MIKDMSKKLYIVGWWLVNNAEDLAFITRRKKIWRFRCLTNGWIWLFSDCAKSVQI